MVIFHLFFNYVFFYHDFFFPHPVTCQPAECRHTRTHTHTRFCCCKALILQGAHTLSAELQVAPSDFSTASSASVSSEQQPCYTLYSVLSDVALLYCVLIAFLCCNAACFFTWWCGHLNWTTAHSKTQITLTIHATHFSVNLIFFTIWVRYRQDTLWFCDAAFVWATVSLLASC